MVNLTINAKKYWLPRQDGVGQPKPIYIPTLHP
jgi:hypothetical protein